MIAEHDFIDLPTWAEFVEDTEATGDNRDWIAYVDLCHAAMVPAAGDFRRHYEALLIMLGKWLGLPWLRVNDLYPDNPASRRRHMSGMRRLGRMLFELQRADWFDRALKDLKSMPKDREAIQFEIEVGWILLTVPFSLGRRVESSTKGQDYDFDYDIGDRRWGVEVKAKLETTNFADGRTLEKTIKKATGQIVGTDLKVVFVRVPERWRMDVESARNRVVATAQKQLAVRSHLGAIFLVWTGWNTPVAQRTQRPERRSLVLIDKDVHPWDARVLTTFDQLLALDEDRWPAEAPF